MNSETAGLLFWGHLLMAVCAVAYLAWWIIFFRPEIPKVEGALYYVGVSCIICAALAGIAGAIVIGIGSSKAISGMRSISGWWFVIGAVALYIALALTTSKLFARPVTTELMLFVVWTALELFCLYALGACGAFGMTRAIVCAVIVTALFIGMLVCYVLYYNLGPLPSFIDGAIPLAAVGVFSITMMILV